MGDPNGKMRYSASLIISKDDTKTIKAIQKAIEEAKAKVAATSEYAVQADKEAPLTGSNIKGIEDENAVLLKSETYDDPSKAAQAVPETVSDTEAAK